MKILCVVEILNRGQEGTFCQVRSKAKKSVVQLRESHGGPPYLVVSSNNDVPGVVFKIPNLSKIRTRFLHEGKMTLEFDEPYVTLMLSKCPVQNLEHFLKKLTSLNPTSGSNQKHTLEAENKLGEAHKSAAREKLVEGQPSNALVGRKRLSKLEEHTVRKVLKKSFQDETCLSFISKIKRRTNEARPVESPFLGPMRKNKPVLRIHCPELFGMPYLTRLELEDNGLTSIKELIDLRCVLKSLSLAKNSLEDIDRDLFQTPALSSIKRLVLNDNKFKRFPKAILDLKKLVELEFRRNVLNVLPYNFHKLRNLRHLYLEENQLNFMPYTFFLMKLITLDISGNPLSLKGNQSTESFNVDGLNLLEIAAEHFSYCISKNMTSFEENFRILPPDLKAYIDNCCICVACRKYVFRFYIVEDYILSSTFPFETVISSSFRVIPTKKIICVSCHNA